VRRLDAALAAKRPLPFHFPSQSCHGPRERRVSGPWNEERAVGRESGVKPPHSKGCRTNSWAASIRRLLQGACNLLRSCTGLPERPAGRRPARCPPLRRAVTDLQGVPSSPAPLGTESGIQMPHSIMRGVTKGAAGFGRPPQEGRIMECGDYSPLWSARGASRPGERERGREVVGEGSRGACIASTSRGIPP
jgi:hypothetical protein